MQDVAKEADVSLMTVSYALRNHPSIPAKTRDRVKAVAKRLGYIRNPLVAALMAQIRGRHEPKYQPTIAYLSTYSERSVMISNSFRKICFESAVSRAQDLGFQVELFLLPDQSDRKMKRLSDILSFRNIQGVILGISKMDDSAIKLEWPQFASCVIGNSSKYLNLNCLDTNYPQIVRLTIERLRSFGYSRIGFLNGVFENVRVDGAVVSAFSGYNMDSPPTQRIAFATLPRKFWNADYVASWVKKHNLDALIIQSHSLHRFLIQAGFSIPCDLGVATLERTPECELAGIDPQPMALGAAAVEAIVSEIYQNQCGIPPIRRTILLDGSWVDGPSAPQKGRGR